MSTHAPAHGHAASPGGHAGAAPHGPHRNYVKIWAILVVLLVISVVGPMTGIRVIMLITAFGVALVKAYMVAKNFMHLDIEKPIVHWLLVVGLALMVLLYGALAPDIQKGEGQSWKKDANFHNTFTHEQPHGSGGHAEPAGAAPGHAEPSPTGAPAARDSAAGSAEHGHP